MAVGEIAVSTLEENLKFLITIFQIIAGVVGVYLVFWLISLIINIRKNKILKKILLNLEEINKKLGKPKKLTL